MKRAAHGVLAVASVRAILALLAPLALPVMLAMIATLAASLLLARGAALLALLGLGSTSGLEGLAAFALLGMPGVLLGLAVPDVVLMTDFEEILDVVHCRIRQPLACASPRCAPLDGVRGPVPHQ